MATYRFKIVGVHYAVNPDSTSRAEETELMHQRTADRLRELDKKRPPVVLIPEPTNPVDARAVMARVEGRPIGYVDKTQLDTLHALLVAGGGRWLKARIEGVEARKHGWMEVCVDAEEEVRVEPRNEQESPWTGWTCSLPVLPATDTQFAQMEAEAMLEDVLIPAPQSGTDLDLMESYIRLWLDSSLHDLSSEARLMREHYIMCLKEWTPQNTDSSRIKALLSELEKQRTAICGQKRMNLRVGKWWNELLASEEMDRLWKTWVARIGEHGEQSMSEMDTLLRALPFDLYIYMDDKRLFFSRLHYSGVPRTQYWQVVSLMLLRERTSMEMKNQEEGGDETSHPHEEETRNEPFPVTIPKELETPEAKKVLARLQKKGILDEDFQPVKLAGWQKGVLAFELAERLRIAKKWVVMATLWRCYDKTLRQYYSKSFNEDKAIEFSKKLKGMIYF